MTKTFNWFTLISVNEYHQDLLMDFKESNMGFTMTPYQEMKEQFDEQVIALRGKHSAPSVDKLPQPRRYQVQTIQAAIQQLDVSTLTGAERARALSGLMLIFENEIRYSYNSLTPEWMKKCLFGPALKEVIGISEKNILDSNSAANITSEALKLIAKMVFENGDTTKPLLEKHPFSAIEGFNLSDIWNRGVTMQADYRKQVMEEAVAGLQKTINDRNALNSTGYFGGMFSGKQAKPEAKSEAKLNELEIDFTPK